MKEKILKIEKGTEAVQIPEEFMVELNLTPGSDVEVLIDKKKQWIVIRPLTGDDFREHFKDSMDTLA